MASETSNKSVFFLKARPESLHAAESYLLQKGWTVHSTDQVKEAISRIIELRPDHIVICMDHHNTRVHILPKLFEEALQIKVIAYMETTATASLAVTAGMPYVLYPPVSGGAVERMAAKVVRDERRAKTSKQKKFLLKPEKPAIEVKEQASQAHSTLMQILHSEPMIEENDDAAAVRKIFALNPDQRPEILYSHTNDSYSNDTDIVRGTHQAIHDVALPLPGSAVLQLTMCREAICFFASSKSHQGFVLCTIANNAEPLHTFVELFKARFAELMEETATDFSVSTAVAVHFQSVQFDDWVRHQAAFSKKFVHLDREYGLAFFEMTAPQIQWVSTPSHQDMIKVSLLDINSQKPLLFDVFIHMPFNNKFLLYNRRGNKFPDLQRSRLLSRGVLDLHIRGREIDQLHRHHLEAYLDQKISEHLGQRPYHEEKLS